MVVLRWFPSMLLHCILFSPTSASIPLPKIAIIGSGAGGSSAAYHLSQLLNFNVDIDVFETKAIIGGRMATVNMLGNEYETGGSIIHPRNRLAVDLVKRLGLSERKDSTTSSITSILKDSDIVFSTSSWTLVTIFKILYRYGLDLNKLQALTEDFISSFDKIYEMHDKGIAYDTVESMLSAMDPKLLNLTTTHFDAFLREYGFKEEFITELVQAITYVNYGQSANIHSLVGQVSVAGAANGLWSVQDGNKLLAVAMLNNSNAKVHLNTKIESIVVVPSGSSFRLSTDKVGKNLLPGTYDKIIIAAPLSPQNVIQFLNFLDQEQVIDAALAPFRHLSYHQTVSTLVAAKEIKTKYRKWLDILSCTPTTFFTSISRVHPVVLTRSERVPVFKVFSPHPLTDSQLAEIFEEIHQVDVTEWWAYPEYNQVPPPLPSFHVLPNIYYLNGIEWAASAIEMSLISGRNAAIQIASKYALSTEEPIQKRRKTEL